MQQNQLHKTEGEIAAVQPLEAAQHRELRLRSTAAKAAAVRRAKTALQRAKRAELNAEADTRRIADAAHHRGTSRSAQ